MAIGSQNAFILKQGIKQHYVFLVCLLCAFSDAGQQFEFTLSAITASFTFFFSLGYGARLLSPLFQNPKSWKVLEFFVGLTMLTIASSLVLT